MSARRARAVLRAHLNDLGTQQEVARELGVSDAMLTYLKQGKRSPGLELAVKLEKRFGIPAAWWVAKGKAA